MLLTAATLQMLSAMQRALFGQNAATAAFLSAVTRQMLPAMSIQAASTLPALAPAPGELRFTSAESRHPVLSRAVTECVQALRAGLGPGVQPHLVQLLLDGGRYGSHVELAPQFVLECLHQRGSDRAPILIGGAASELVGASPGPPPSLSILAAHLPGVELHAFHSRDASLPELPHDAWARIISGSAAQAAHEAAQEAGDQPAAQPTTEQESAAADGPARAADSAEALGFTRQPASSSAAFLLAEPHFGEVGALAQRLRGALPAAPLLGGVLRAGAWGGRSLRGALFLGDAAHDAGAVGCLLHGPIQVDQVVVRGWQPRLDMFDAATSAAPQGRQGPASRERAGRSLDAQQMEGHEEAEAAARMQLARQLHRYAEALAGGGGFDPAAMAAFCYSSGVSEHGEGPALAAALPNMPLQGIKCDTPLGGCEAVPAANGALWPGSATTCGILRGAAPPSAGGGRSVTVDG